MRRLSPSRLHEQRRFLPLLQRLDQANQAASSQSRDRDCAPPGAHYVTTAPTGTDHVQLADSFRRFVGTDGYDLTTLRTDLARFTFLFGHTEGEQLQDPEA